MIKVRLKQINSKYIFVNQLTIYCFILADQIFLFICELTNLIKNEKTNLFNNRSGDDF